MNPFHSNDKFDAFKKSGRGFYCLVINKDGNNATCKCIEHVCDYLLRKKKSVRDARLFQVGIVIHKNTSVQLFHRDDSECSCHVSSDYEGLLLMLHVLID